MAYTYDKKLDELVHAVAKRDFPGLEECRIKVLSCSREKKSRGMHVYADTEKLSDKLSALTDVDFVITFYDGWQDLPRKTLEILCIHELHHVGYTAEVGGVKKRIIPHDVQDFFSVIEAFGLDWICSE